MTDRERNHIPRFLGHKILPINRPESDAKWSYARHDRLDGNGKLLDMGYEQWDHWDWLCYHIRTMGRDKIEWRRLVREVSKRAAGWAKWQRNNWVRDRGIFVEDTDGDGERAGSVMLGYKRQKGQAVVAEPEDEHRYLKQLTHDIARV